MVKIGVILGSTRPERFGAQPAKWLMDIAQKRTDDTEFELIDLAEVNLPLLDEPTPPSFSQYTKDHTKDWSKKVNELDGSVLVTPEYNHSFPAALKNALDFVFFEWNYKPVSFLSYGSAAGGARAVEQLRPIAAELKMYDIREQVMLHNYWGSLNEQGEYQFSVNEEKAATAMLDELVFWATQMKDARTKRPQQ